MGQHPPDVANDVALQPQNLNSTPSTFHPQSLRKPLACPSFLAGYGMAVDLVQFNDWTEETIANRQADMAKVAKTIWALTF